MSVRTVPWTGSLPSWLDSSFLVDARHPDKAVEHAWNVSQIRRTNAGSLDLIMYGDSITAHLHESNRAAWTSFVGKHAALALGVSGNMVPHLAWRLAKGGELPAFQPRAIAILIGINDLHAGHTDPTPHLAWLLKFLKTVMPTTKIVLMALLPTTRVSVTTTNVAYEKLALENGLVFAPCGRSMNPSDTTLFSDGLHPTNAGYGVVFPALAPLVFF